MAFDAQLPPRACLLFRWIQCRSSQVDLMIVNILKILLRPRYNDLTIQYSGIKLSFFEGSNKITRFFDRITEMMMIIFRISVISMINGLFSPGCAHRWLRVKQGHLGLLKVATESPPFPSVHLDSRVDIVMDHESLFMMSPFQNSNLACLFLCKISCC